MAHVNVASIEIEHEVFGNKRYARIEFEMTASSDTKIETPLARVETVDLYGQEAQRRNMSPTVNSNDGTEATEYGSVFIGDVPASTHDKKLIMEVWGV